ncbi:MAG: sulfatase-like hydrolase/transferase [Peptostreptococcaceae bacterium]|nr:sulfatase-like hydrolase/transferase [Peptostreptococcaceae bacterium]
MNELRNEIISVFEKNELDRFSDLIEEYEQKFPYDLEIFTWKGAYHFCKMEWEEAERFFLEGIRINPYHYDLNFNLALLYEQTGRYFLAYEYYSKSNYLQEGRCGDIESILNLLIEKMQKKSEELTDEEEIAKFHKELEDFNRDFEKNLRDGFGMKCISPWGWEMEIPFIGEFLPSRKEYYVANYNRIGIMNSRAKTYDSVEIRKAVSYRDHCRLYFEEEHLIPVAIDESGFIEIEHNGIPYKMYQFGKTYHYYRLSGAIRIKAADRSPVIVGEPVVYRKQPQRKSLVLSLFIDGLTQAFLNENDFSECMPNTYRYFSKGIHCVRAYSTGEWTYPSLASYFTGVYHQTHKMFLPVIDQSLPEGYKILGEYMKEAGFTTGTFSGNWRTNPDYGYIRGMDKTVTGTYGERFSVREIVAELIDNMDAMKETNQYYYVNIMELHDVADEYKLPLQVQTALSLKELRQDMKNDSTSVKQVFSEEKEARYREQMKYVDKYLGILFEHIRKTFSDQEVLVTLFSDHGQGFLIHEGEFFLDDKRTQVPLLINDGGKELRICEEPISAVDYLPIMGSLVGFEVEMKSIDGILPKYFGGESERDFTVSENLFPGDTYKIALRSKKDVFYFESKEEVEYDGRVLLDEFDVKLMDIDGNPIFDADREKRYIDFVMDHMRYFRIYR